MDGKDAWSGAHLQIATVQLNFPEPDEEQVPVFSHGRLKSDSYNKDRRKTTDCVGLPLPLTQTECALGESLASYRSPFFPPVLFT